MNLFSKEGRKTTNWLFLFGFGLCMLIVFWLAANGNSSDLKVFEREGSLYRTP